MSTRAMEMAVAELARREGHTPVALNWVISVEMIDVDGRSRSITFFPPWLTYREASRMSLVTVDMLAEKEE